MKTTSIDNIIYENLTMLSKGKNITFFMCQNGCNDTELELNRCFCKCMCDKGLNHFIKLKYTIKKLTGSNIYLYN